MNDTVDSRLQTHRRMQEFCNSHCSDFAPSSLGARLSTRLSTQLSDLPILLRPRLPAMAPRVRERSCAKRGVMICARV